jgi:hypothetical protein
VEKNGVTLGNLSLGGLHAFEAASRLGSFKAAAEEAMDETVRAIGASGATHVMPIVLHLRKGGAREWWMRWLRKHRPDLVPRYRELYGDRAYAPGEFQNEVAGRVRDLARRHRVGAADGPRRARRIAEPPPQPEQLVLPGG